MRQYKLIDNPWKVNREHIVATNIKLIERLTLMRIYVFNHKNLMLKYKEPSDAPYLKEFMQVHMN